MIFKKTGKFGLGAFSHDHIVSIDEATGEAFVSFDKKHTHKAMYFPPQEESQDEFGNIIPGSPGGYLLEPADDGHTHNELFEIVPPKNKKSDLKKDSDRVAEVLDLFKDATQIEGESHEKAEESWDFYKGKQWDDVDKNYLIGLDRSCLTINEIERHVDILCGHYSDVMTDIQYRPQEGGDQKVADLLNALTKQILYNCNFRREDLKVFLSQIVRGRGAFNIYVDFIKDIRGTIRVESFPNCNLWCGPHDQEDLSDCEYLFKERMFSLDKLKQLFPDHADKLESQHQELSEIEGMKNHVQYEANQYALSDNRNIVFEVNGKAMVNIARKSYRVLECWQKVYLPSTVIVSSDGTEFFDAKGWSSSDISRIESIVDSAGNKLFYKISRVIPRIRITKVCGSLVLADEFPADLPEDDFYIVPVYAKKDRNSFWGKVESAKDPQRGVNKRASQAIDIANKASSYGFFITPGTFENPTEERKFMENSTSPGFVAKITDFTNKPQTIEGVKFPSEIVQLMALDSQKVAESMNVVVDTGQANAPQSHLIYQYRNRLQGNQFLLENMNLAKTKLGRLLVGLIQRYYDADRIYRMLNTTSTSNPVMIGEQPIQDFTSEDIEVLLNTADLVNYDVIVSQTESSVSTRTATYMLLSEIMQSGAQVPPEMFIKLSDIPQSQKDELLQILASAQEGQMQQQQTAAETEVEKTLIAQGLIPPATAEKYQLNMGMNTNTMQQGQQMAEVQAPAEGAPLPEEMAAEFPRRKIKKISINDPETGSRKEVVIETEE